MANQDRQQEMEEQLGAIRDFFASPPGWIFAGIVATAVLIGIVLTGFPGVLGVALAIGIGVTAVALAVTIAVLIWRRRD